MTGASGAKYVRGAWIVTALIGCATAAGYFAALAGIAMPFRPRLIVLARAVVVLFLAWGISRHSRVAILAMLALFAASRLDLLWRGRHLDERVGAGVSLLVVGYLLVQGARAIFAYHRDPSLRTPARDAA
jgi:hypothetical protein